MTPSCRSCPFHDHADLECLNPGSPWNGKKRLETSGTQCPDHPDNIREFRKLRPNHVPIRLEDSDG